MLSDSGLNYVFDKKRFESIALASDVVQIQEEPITLHSGRQSHVYFDWSKAFRKTAILYDIVDLVLAFAGTQDLVDEDISYLGVPEGCTPLAVVANFQHYVYMDGDATYLLPVSRKVSKGHGSAQERLYVAAPEGKVILLEDVLTSGDSLAKEINKARQIEELEILGAIVLVDRNQKRDDGMSGKEYIESLGVNCYCMLDGVKLLEKSYDQHPTTDALARKLEREYHEFGVKELKLLN